MSLLFGGAPLEAGNFTTGSGPAVLRGVHEIVLAGDGAVANPFDTIVQVRFQPPSGPANARLVWAFYDGGDTWRAYVYANEAGEWTWSTTCESDARLHGRSGRFACGDSKLRGRLLVHPRNARQWMTEDGRWFLNLNDTSYFLLCSHDGEGAAVTEADVHAYVKDAADRGITSFRSFIATGPRGFIGPDRTDRHRWNDLFSDPEWTRPNLDALRLADERLRWLLDEHPDAYLQFILFPLGKPWRSDEKFWGALSPSQRERILRYLVARFAAFPQIFWLIVNDAHFGPETIRPTPGKAPAAPRVVAFPGSCAMVNEVGTFLQRHDPWRHPISAGPARGAPFHFDHEPWATYVHLEDNYDVSAQRWSQYEALAKPVFLGEDRYEQDHPGTLDPRDMRYFQRRLFWSWLLSGGSANYGGRWWVLHPYSQTDARPARSIHHHEHTYTAPLTGLDSARVIRDYFESRRIELSDFVPDHPLASDPEIVEPTRAAKLMRRDWDEFLVYHPHAAADKRDTRVVPNRAAHVRLDLRRAAGAFRVEWCRASDGETRQGDDVAGGVPVELPAPWPGHDVILRLSRVEPR